MTIVKVKVTAILPVEFPDEYDDDKLHFIIEDNGCPGTGSVGAYLEDLITGDIQMMNELGMSSCWACNHYGENEIVEIIRDEDRKTEE